MYLVSIFLVLLHILRINTVMNKNLLLYALLVALLFPSCIRDEALNSECDIIDVDSEWLDSVGSAIIGKPIISNYTVVFVVKEGVDASLFTPRFILTKGAKIMNDSISYNGESGVVQHYTTYSEDGKWSKRYDVYYNASTIISKDKVFDFEHYALDNTGRYNVWFEVDEYGTQRNIWASGNAGYAFTGQGDTAADFPTAANENGVSGSCVKLTTSDTGIFGQLAGMPIAAGNIFLGEFNSGSAMREPLRATRFGVQMVPAKPLYIKGYYKYKSGEVFTDKSKKVVPEKRDTCAIYSVLFEVDPENPVPLNGENVTSSERIVLIAELKNHVESDEWVEFEIPYEYINNKQFDYDRVANNGYAITFVASSSKGGDFFEGAVGSTLYVDEVTIVWEDK